MHRKNPGKIIGIAGGSGSGKSTLAISLCRKYPEKCVVLHLDDYFRPRAEAPLKGVFVNWDHPDSLDFKKLRQDLLSLRQGHPLTFFTKSELYHPTYDDGLKNKIEYVLLPTNLIILEGYLCLADEEVRDLLDFKIYLDIPIEASSKRRSANKFAIQEDYFKEVLLPMHKEFVEPTRSFADLVIEVENMSLEEILAKTEEIIL